MHEFSRLAEHITKPADTFHGDKFIALPKPPSRHKYRVLCLTSLTAEFVIHSDTQKRDLRSLIPPDLLLQSDLASGVLSFICYPATCGPKRHGGGSAAAESTAVAFYTTIFP